MGRTFDRLFVITYGRSGSTLLQGLLNALPGYRVYGENGGFLTRLHDVYEALADANRHLADPKKDTPRHAWFGSSRYDRQSLTVGFRDFADRMLFLPMAEPDVRVFGFKEVRYSDLGAKKLADFLAFVTQIYPKSAIVFNSRNIDDVVTSGWWRNVPRVALRTQLAEFDRFAADYAAGHGDHAIHVRYDALVDPDRREVARLLSFLGERLSAAEADSVFAANHSYANRTLTQYLSGRGANIELLEPDWWKTNVEEFRIDVVRRPRFAVAKGIFLPAADGAARLILRAESRDFEVVTTGPTPRLAKLFPGNPRGAMAGFRLEFPPTDEARLFGVRESFETRLVAVVKVAARRPAAAKGAAA